MISGKIQREISNSLQFPSLPSIATQILHAVQNDDDAMAELLKIIPVDPVLTAKLLKVANSSLYGHVGKISSLQRALVLLGTNTIKSIALSFILFEKLKDENQSFDPDLFWRRTVTMAVAAELLSQQLQVQHDDIFLIALLADFGLMVAQLSKGQEYRILMDQQKDYPVDLVELEQEELGFDHQQIGYELLRYWNLPDTIIIPILYHHRPDNAPEDYRKIAWVLDMASTLTEIYSESETTHKATSVQTELANHVGLTEKQSLAFIDTVADNCQEIFSYFNLDPKTIQPYSRLLEQANKELGKLTLSNAQIILELQEAKNKIERLSHKLQESNNRLKALVYQDSLTGLFNYRRFQEELTRELARTKRYPLSLSLVMFDLDNFKQINDQFGHLAGDQVLANIAIAVKRTIRTHDILARIGGDEFAVILTSTNYDGVKFFSETLRLCISGVVTNIKGQDVCTTASIGVASLSAQRTSREVTKEMLIELADKNMYQAKNKQGNQVIISDL